MTLDSDVSAPPPAVSLPADGVGLALSGREPADEIRRKAAVIQATPLLKQMLDAMPYMVMVLNHHRQVVAANAAMLSLLDAAIDDVTGKRPGEVIGCIHASEGSDGCGTSESCTTCGAVQAVLASLAQQQKVVRECAIRTKTPRGTVSVDLRVTATPIRVGQDQFIVAAVEDISQAKRLAVLQRTFFHDVLNTAGCIHGFVQFLNEEPDPEIGQRLIELTEQLIESIQAQQNLNQAEQGDLAVRPVPVETLALLDQLRMHYENHSIAVDRTIVLDDVWDGMLITDPTILHRILGNMLKNALEAVQPGETVTLGCQRLVEGVEFTVQNPGVIPKETQLQIFHRSFSTKAQSGRGIGTYSMKLLGEHYLQGQVDFTSREPEGTIFRLTLPEQIQPSR